MTAQSKKIAGATTALVLLTALNFVNYTDRYILPGVQSLVQKEFSLSDQRIGALTLCFFITYMLAAPLTGWLGDRFPRKPLIIGGALLWSACNVLTATVHSYVALNIRHMALGVGEASFGIFGPALLSDFFPEEERNRVLTIFYIAIPVGAALGYGMGGVLVCVARLRCGLCCLCHAFILRFFPRIHRLTCFCLNPASAFAFKSVVRFCLCSCFEDPD